MVPRSLRAPGSIPPTRSASSRMARQQSLSLALAAYRASSWSWWTPHRVSTTASSACPAHRPITDMAGVAALPRKSGELVFQDPWEGIVFAMAVALCEQKLYQWDEFRNHLITEIAAAERMEPAREKPGYYECWLAAFETLLVEKALLTKEAIDARTARLAKAVSTPRRWSL